MPALDLGAIDARAAELAVAGFDERTRDEFVRLASPLAARLARRFAGRGEPLDDLVQVAHLGLMKAVDRFDPARAVRFSTYATPTIIGELKRHFRDTGWVIHVPRVLKDRALAVRAVIPELSQELKRSPMVGEIAARTGLDIDDVIEALDASDAYTPDSLDAPAGEGQMTIDVRDEDASLELVERWASIEPLLERLDERERKILYLRFVRELTQNEIATQIGYSQMHVSRLLARTLRHMREVAGEREAESDARATSSTPRAGRRA